MYTKEQVEQMLSGCIDQTMAFAENGGIMTEEKAKEIMVISSVHPASFDEQIEAMRELIRVHEYFVREFDSGKPDEILDTFTNSVKILAEPMKPFLDKNEV